MKPRALTQSVLALALGLTLCVGVSTVHAETRASVGVPPQVTPDPNTEVTFFVGLPYDARGLEQEARAVSDPSSAAFRRYLPVMEAATRFGATPEAIAVLRAAARSLDLRVVPDPTRLFARVTGTVAAWEKAMGEQVQYTSAATNVLLGGEPNDGYVFSPVPQTVMVGGVPVPSLQSFEDIPQFSPAPASLAKAVTWFLPSFDQYVPAADTPPGASNGSVASAQVLLTPGSPGSPVPTNGGTPLGVSCAADGSTPVRGIIGPGSQGSFFTPDQVSQAYGLPRVQARYGAGASGDVAIISLNGGFLQSDLQSAANCFGHTAPEVDIRRGTGVGQAFINVDDETSLDLQTVSWALRESTRIRLIQVTNSATSYLDGYSLLLADPDGPPMSASLSYGSCEEGLTSTPGWRTQESLFHMAAVVGTSLFVSSGDSGASVCQVGAWATFLGLVDSLESALGDLPDATDAYLREILIYLQGQASEAAPTASYPATSPWVTAVGGTQLTLGANNQIVREAVWNDLQYLPSQLSLDGFLAANTVATGGTSSVFASPAYQSPLAPRNLRMVPDLSAMAAISPGMAIFLNGALQVVGGTSQASPLTAAGSALISEALTARGRAPLGFLNPWLYATAASHPRMFTDVTAGDNQYPVPYGTNALNVPACCQAQPGYDTASGFGSLRYEAFLARALR